MSLQPRALGPCIGAEVEGIDLREPVSAVQAEEIHAAMDRYAVLVFHGQPLTDEQHLAFTRALGAVEDTRGNNICAGLQIPGCRRSSPMGRTSTPTTSRTGRMIYSPQQMIRGYTSRLKL